MDAVISLVILAGLGFLLLKITGMVVDLEKTKILKGDMDRKKLSEPKK